MQKTKQTLCQIVLALILANPGITERQLIQKRSGDDETVSDAGITNSALHSLLNKKEIYREKTANTKGRQVYAYFGKNQKSTQTSANFDTVRSLNVAIVRRVLGQFDYRPYVMLINEYMIAGVNRMPLNVSHIAWITCFVMADSTKLQEFVTRVRQLPGFEGEVVTAGEDAARVFEDYRTRVSPNLGLIEQIDNYFTSVNEWHARQTTHARSKASLADVLGMIANGSRDLSNEHWQILQSHSVSHLNEIV